MMLTMQALVEAWRMGRAYGRAEAAADPADDETPTPEPPSGNVVHLADYRGTRREMITGTK